MSSRIYICDVPYEVDNKVITYKDDSAASFSAYTTHHHGDPGKLFPSHPASGLGNRLSRYRSRRQLGQVERQSKEERLRRLKGVTRQFVIHLDGLRTAAECFRVLHNERGLSVHFMIDGDGVIYQTLDLMHCAFHAAGVNEISVGVELQNRGDAHRFPNFYPQGERRKVTCRIHGHQFLAWDFTAAQYQAMTKLCKVVARALDLPLASPQSGGELSWTTLPNPRSFRGFVGHYHLSRNKWDPGPFDFRRLFRGISARVTFPLSPAHSYKADTAEAEDKLFAKDARRHAALSERNPLIQAHFPVGPLGASRLWHGGIHLMVDEGDPVFAPMMGEIMAARTGPNCPVGSCNFVLCRHKLFSSRQELQVFTLFYHLQRERDTMDSHKTPPWIVRSRRRGWRDRLMGGEVTLLNEPIKEGEVLGHVGTAGPPAERSPQVHFAVFAPLDLGKALDPGQWQLLQSDGKSRLCDQPAIINAIDRAMAGKQPDGRLSRRELTRFFTADPDRDRLYQVAIRYRSEWTPGDWEEELARAGDFAALDAAERRRLIAQQLTPTLFWTPALARHAGLPVDGVVYAYHPVGFLLWYRDLARRTATTQAVELGDAATYKYDPATAGYDLDGDSQGDMIDEEDHFSGDAGKKLKLEDLVEGYPDDQEKK